MELSNVGATCALSSCRQRDFLPFSCTNCHQKFCLDHRTPASHHCFALEASSANTAECPVCGQVVIARSGESLDLAVATHMDAGCKKTTVVAQKCLVPSCKNHDVLRLKCDGCGRISCVAHRSPDLHDCPSIKQAAAPNNSNNNSVLPPVAASRVGNRVRALMSSLHKKKKTNSSAMVMRQTAEGDAKLAVERRWCCVDCLQYNGVLFLTFAGLRKFISVLAAASQSGCF
jgi:predicted nucleic acid binding AN1-type Zn finger protein